MKNNRSYTYETRVLDKEWAPSRIFSFSFEKFFLTSRTQAIGFEKIFKSVRKISLEGAALLIQNSRYESISAFDLDRTLLKGNSSFLFGLYLCKKRYLSLLNLFFIISCRVRHELDLLSAQKLHESVFQRLFWGKQESIIKNFALEFLDLKLESLLYKPAIERLQTALASGHYTILLSSSPDFLVRPIALKLGFTAWRSAKYAVDADHRFNRLCETMLGNKKAECLEEIQIQYGIDKENITAYSDSHLDLPFLLAAGSAVGVNPNRKLRTICKSRNWPII